MLHWLQPNTPRRISFFIELTIVSVLFHAVIFFMLFFCYLGSDSGYHITLGAPCVDLADIVVMPFTASAVQSVQPKPKVVPSREAPAKKAMPKKRVPTTSIKKVPVQKKVDAQKKAEPQEKRVAQPEKKVEPKKSPEKALQKEVKKTLQPSAAPAIDHATKKVPVLQEQPAVVSQKEYDALELQQLLQEELELHWQPPAGLAPDLSCEVKVFLDRQGSIKQLDFVAPSGVLIYDIHAQSTLMALQYPKQTWGKQLTVTFKQT